MQTKHSPINRVPVKGSRRALGITPGGVHQTIARLAQGTPRALIGGSFPTGDGRHQAAAIRAASQGRRHAKDGVLFLRAVVVTLNEISKLLDRASGLAQQARSVAASDVDRCNQDVTLQSILPILEKLASESLFNGEPLFGRSPIQIPLGENSTIEFYPGDLKLGLGGDLKTLAGVNALVACLLGAQNVVAAYRTGIDAGMLRLIASSDRLGIQKENLTAAQSQVRDAHLADGVVNLTKFQILNSAGNSPLGIPTREAASILALLG